MRNTMDKKKKILIGAVLTVVILLAGVMAGFLIANAEKKGSSPQNVENGALTNNERPVYDEKESTESPKNQEAQAQFTPGNAWESDGRKYIQYELNIFSTGKKNIESWKITFPAGSGTVMEQSWNCGVESSTAEDGTVSFTLSPVDYNREIPAGEHTQGIGFIISRTENYELKAYQLEAVIEGVAVTVTDDGQSGDSLAEQGQDNHQSDDSQTGIIKEETQNGQTGGTSDGSQNSDSSGKSGGLSGTGSSPRPASGGLRVSGTTLTDASGNAVQLRGVSTHGLAWFPEYVNKEAFETLRDDWGANVVRLAMYTEEYGGYCNGGDKEALKQLIDDGVSYATELGMYVIIDWHILSDCDPNQNKDEAIAFFREMAEAFADNDNVLYEICNEPNGGTSWDSIKSYAEEVIPVIRAQKPDAVILVGTPTWSQEIDKAAASPLDDSNVMYTLHFYAGTHKDDLRNRLETCVQNGLPVFVSEFGMCDASGNGANDFVSTTKWLDLLNKYQISFCCWNLANKDESSSVFKASSTALSDWTDDDFNESGRWIRDYFRGMPQK